jgi:hypothetical protein
MTAKRTLWAPNCFCITLKVSRIHCHMHMSLQQRVQKVLLYCNLLVALQKCQSGVIFNPSILSTPTNHADTKIRRDKSDSGRCRKKVIFLLFCPLATTVHESCRIKMCNWTVVVVFVFVFVETLNNQ